MLDDKEYLERLRQKSIELKLNVGKKGTDSSLNPGYRPVEKPSKTDPPVKLDLNLEAALEEFRKRTSGQARTPFGSSTGPTPSVNLPNVTDDRTKPSANENKLVVSNRISPAEDNPPGGGSNDRQVVQDMITTMRELTEEVKQLRTQIEAKPDAVSTYPRGRPPGIPEVASVVDSPPVPEDAPQEHIPINILEDFDVSLPEVEPDVQRKRTKRTKKPEPKKKKAISVLTSVLFYVIIIAMVFGAFLLKSGSGGRPTMIAGFSAFTVLTSSMEDVYPKGSLIITRSVDAKDLKVGDDITYMVSETSSITHRIIGITENFQDTGERAFETKGVMNPNPDKDPVAASNVVGRVIFHSKALGSMAAFVKSNWPLLLFLVVVLIGLITFLKWNSRKSAADKEALPEEATGEDPKTNSKKQKKSKTKENKNNES